MSKGTPTRSIGIDDDLWEEAKVVAARRSESVTEVIREALKKYVREGAPTTGRRASREIDSQSGPQALSVFYATTAATLQLSRADMQAPGRTFEPGLRVTAVPIGRGLWHLTAVAEGHVWVGLSSPEEIGSATLLTTISGNSIS